MLLLGFLLRLLPFTWVMSCSDGRRKGAELEENQKKSNGIVPAAEVTLTVMKGEGFGHLLTSVMGLDI